MTMYAYNVFLENENGEEQETDTVFYSIKEGPEEVRKSLINHDGYDPNIWVELED